MSQIASFLTFQENGEDAVKFYVSLFENAKIHSIVRSEEDGPIKKGGLLHASFEIDGQHFMAMDGGQYFRFEQGFSIYVDCDTQEEIDRFWQVFTDEGEEQMCGWVKDKYGISWQIVPSILGQLLNDPDASKARRVMDAMLQMKKFDIQTLQQAYDEQDAGSQAKTVENPAQLQGFRDL